MWLAVWVDDTVIVDNDSALRDRFVAALSKRFPTEDKGELTWILNLAVTRDRPNRTLTLSQSLYLNDLVRRFAPGIADGQGAGRRGGLTATCSSLAAGGRASPTP